MSRRSHALSRRRFLQGAGASLLALPMLEAFRGSTARAAAECQPPRLLVYYVPNGRRPEWWIPSAAGGTLTFPAQSAALQPYASRALSLVGLDNTAARNSPGAAHAMGTGTVMTGTTIPDLTGLKATTSLDQIVAQSVGARTRFRSLQWSAGEPGPCDVGGASCAYTQSISWSGYGAPLIPTIDPVSAFNRLFKSGTDGLTGAAGEVRRQSLGSVLDYARDDATWLERNLGRDDRARLDEYFTALREVERSLSGAVPACEVPVDGPGPALPYPDRVRAFHELIALAFQCDQTRVLSFMLEFGLSGRSHDFLNAPGAHHALSHYGNDTQRAYLELIEVWQAQQIAHLLQLLAQTPGMDGQSLLDETLVLVIPSMGAGSNHDHAQNAPLLFGGAGIVQTDGRQVSVPGTPLTRLHASLLDAFGIEGQFGLTGARFGDDGTSAIAGVVGNACRR